METLKGICYLALFFSLLVVVSAIVGDKIAYMFYGKKGVKITGKIVDMDCIREYRQEMHVTILEYHVEDKTRLLLLSSVKGDEIGKEISVYKHGDYIIRDSAKNFDLNLYCWEQLLRWLL